MKIFFLYLILSRLTGNPLLTIVVLVLLYGVADKVYLRLLPDFSAPFKRNRQIKSLLEGFKINPANVKAAQDLGILYFEKKKYAKALEYLKKANERIDDSARLYLYMGMSCIETGKGAEGVNYINKAVGLDKGVGYGLPYIYLLEYEMKKDGYPKDLSALQESFDRFANTENFNRMGKVYKNNKNKPKAKEMFESSLNSYSYCPRSLRKLHRKWAFSSRINKIFLL